MSRTVHESYRTRDLTTTRKKKARQEKRQLERIQREAAERGYIKRLIEKARR
jgi:hypothetical protein